VGLSVTVAKEDAQTALAVLKEQGEDAYLLGEIIKSDDGVVLI